MSHGYLSDDENHSRSSEPDLAIDMSAGASHNNSMHNNSLMDVDDRSDHNSTVASADSPTDGDSSHMGPRGLYLGKLPYLTPTILQKKLPLRSDRWTPGTPLPTTPECKHCGYTLLLLMYSVSTMRRSTASSHVSIVTRHSRHGPTLSDIPVYTLVFALMCAPYVGKPSPVRIT